MERLSILSFFKQYRNKWINYCEIIIDSDGKIIIANPSHTEMMLKLTGRSREDIYSEMPIMASPIHWFVDYLGYVSVWYDFQIVPKSLNEKQKRTLELLANHKMIVSNQSVVSDLDIGN